MQLCLQFIVEDIGRYNYNGEIQDKLLEINQPNLVKIKQKQVCCTKSCALPHQIMCAARKLHISVVYCAECCVTDRLSAFAPWLRFCPVWWAVQPACLVLMLVAIQKSLCLTNNAA